MGSGLITITVQEAQGPIAASADLDKLAVVAGWTSAGAGLSAFFMSGSSAITAVGYGDAVDVGTQIIEQRFPSATSVKFPCAFYTTGQAGSPGVYGAIDNSGVLGTCVPTVDAAVLPFGTYEARIRIIDDGASGAGTNIGVTGITYQWALDNVPTWSDTTPLGTLDYITIPNSGVKFDLNPSSAELTALYTKVTLLQTTLTGTGHFTIVSGSPAIHAAGDTTDDTALAAVPAATTPATAVALFNACLSYLGVHGASAVYHAGADAPLATALASITPAVTVADVDARLNSLITAYNAHRINVTSVHGSADSTNTITAYTAAPGTLKTGATWTVRTLGPVPSTANLTTMFADLVASKIDFGILVLAFPLTPALAAFVTTGLNSLETVGKKPIVIARSRVRDFETSESDATWNTLVSAQWAPSVFSDSRIHLRTTLALITDAVTTREYLRSDLAQFAADVVRVDRSVWPSAPADQINGAPNVRLSNSSDVLVGHDESPRGTSTGLSNTTLGNRFGAQQRMANALTREAAYNCFPFNLYAAGEKIRHIMARRVANAMERAAINAGQSAMGGKLFFDPADPSDPGSANMLTDASRNALHGAIFDALTTEFANDIQNADDADVDTGLVQVVQTVTVTDGQLLGVTVYLVPLLFGYLERLIIILSPKE